ncbi:hypothetical protein AAG565_13120 [Fontimonas sp. SYSU GA230001]|uniref:hypothetical protein n=1 Tax=Fontimonas sp. SYSU GA230001 TaxID=3142450 RepID=UPI0032B458FA
MRRATTLLLLALLCACGDARHEPLASGDDTRALCLDSQCGSPRQLVDLPDLENIVVTDAGRVFVTGQQGLYEIRRDADGGYRATTLASGGCSGIVQRGALIYALCPDTSGAAALTVFAADADVPVPQSIHTLTGMTLPNGLAVGPDDTLFVTDGPIAVQPQIVRLTLDAADPRVVRAQDGWLLTWPDYPNGLAIRDRALYTTLFDPTRAAGDVARIEIRADGSAGAVERLHTRGIMDDLELAGDTLLVTDWQNNRLFQIGLDGGLLQQTDPLSYRQPSALAVAPAAWFDPPAVLVTERYTGRGLWVHARR